MRRFALWLVFLMSNFSFIAPSNAVDLTFSQPDFDWLANGGSATPYHIWTVNDYWRQNFVSTGLPSASKLVLDLFVNDAASETLNLDVLVNSNNVGSFSLNPGDSGSSHQFNFSFGSIAGDDYLIEIVAANTLSPGVSSYSIQIDGPSTARLTPEPTSFALAGLGLIGVACARRRRA